MLSLENIVWSVPGGERIIDGISYTVGEGKLVVVTGPNGGGKTTIAKLIAGLEARRGADPLQRRGYYRAGHYGAREKGNRLRVSAARAL